MAQRQQADLGQPLSAQAAKLLVIRPVAAAVTARAATQRHSGAAHFPKGKRRPHAKWVPTPNRWVMGWDPCLKAWAAYSWSFHEKEHRGKVFRTRAGLDAYAAFLGTRNWEISYS